MSIYLMILDNSYAILMQVDHTAVVGHFQNTLILCLMYRNALHVVLDRMQNSIQNSKTSIFPIQKLNLVTWNKKTT